MCRSWPVQIGCSEPTTECSPSFHPYSSSISGSSRSTTSTQNAQINPGISTALYLQSLVQIRSWNPRSYSERGVADYGEQAYKTLPPSLRSLSFLSLSDIQYLALSDSDLPYHVPHRPRNRLKVPVLRECLARICPQAQKPWRHLLPFHSRPLPSSTYRASGCSCSLCGDSRGIHAALPFRGPHCH